MKDKLEERASDSTCLLQFLPPARCLLGSGGTDTVDSKAFRLKSGIQVYAFRNAHFVFDFERWPPGTSVMLPEADWIPGERVSPKLVEADDEAFKHMANRVQALNCFLACLSTALSSVQSLGVSLEQELSPTTYVPIPREELSKLTSKSVRTFIITPGKEVVLWPPGIEIREETLTKTLELLDSVLDALRGPRSSSCFIRRPSVISCTIFRWPPSSAGPSVKER